MLHLENMMNYLYIEIIPYANIAIIYLMLSPVKQKLVKEQMTTLQVLLFSYNIIFEWCNKKLINKYWIYEYYYWDKSILFKPVMYYDNPASFWKHAYNDEYIYDIVGNLYINERANNNQKWDVNRLVKLKNNEIRQLIINLHVNTLENNPMASATRFCIHLWGRSQNRECYCLFNDIDFHKLSHWPYALWSYEYFYS